MKNYSLKVIQQLIDIYVFEYNGQGITIDEGCLGYGKMLLVADGKKSVVITEYFINEWSSGHKIRKYNKLPKKYSIHL
jgi:hypothetical protein